MTIFSRFFNYLKPKKTNLDEHTEIYYYGSCKDEKIRAEALLETIRQCGIRPIGITSTTVPE